jgi:hypothetical protein
MAFASSIKDVGVAMKLGGACGGFWYCFGAILLVVMGRVEETGRMCEKREATRGPQRVDARMTETEMKDMITKDHRREDKKKPEWLKARA